VSSLLIRRAELDGRVTADVRVAGATVHDVAPDLAPRPGEAVLDARGAALLPGLHDHHLHLHAVAAHDASVRCGPPDVTGPGDLGAVLAAATPDPRGWIRGVGYHESVAGLLDAAALDRWQPAFPVRVQHRSGAVWFLNGAAIRALGLAGAEHPGVERDADGAPTGRLWRADDWLRDRLPPTPPPALDAVGARLSGLGITGVTDATPDLGPAAVTGIAAAHERGSLPQRVHLLGLPLGAPPPGTGVTAGPYKLVLADSGLPHLGELTGRIRAAHAAGRAVAVHCVTREALILTLTALADAGPRDGDRLEHAALVPQNLVDRVAALGLRVVTQPGFLADRGDDFLRDLPADEHADLYRLGSLHRAGVCAAPASDAPYGPLDPWAVIAAATTRRTRSGRVAGPAERIGAAVALAGYLSPATDPGGSRRRVAPDVPADLVLLHAPLAAALAAPSADLVRATVIAGDVRHGC
jgi:predicted amidohydrolase YtcJ